MKNILKKWQKEAKKKNKNKHQWGWFVNPNAGNVEYNNAFFNHVTGADGGDTSALVSAAAGGEGLGESMKQETVTLHYDDIEVEGNYGPLDWETGFPKYEYHELIDYDYEVDKDEVFEELWEMAFETPSKLPEAEGISEEELEAYIDTNFYELFEKHYDELLERFYERAEEEANDKYIYDEYKYMESIDLAEALNSIDAKTCNKFDLVNSYHAASLTEAKKQKLATLIKKGASAHKLAEFFDDNSDWQIGLELFADNGKEYKVVSVLEDREVDGYELSVVSAIGNEASNADEEVYFVLLDSDIEWGPVETSEEALEWASDVQDGYYNTEEDNFDYDDDIDFTDLYGAHGEYDDDYGVQKRPSMKESAEDGQLDRNSDAEGNGRVKTFKLNGTTYKVSKLEDSFGKGGYVARWEDDSDNGLGYNNRGWISFDKNSYALHNEASKPIKDFMYVVSAHDRRPTKSVADKLIATAVSMFGDDAVDTDSLDKKVGENLITEDWKDSSRYCVVTKMPPKFENILQGTSNDFDTAERIAIDAMKRYASSPWEDDDRKIEAIENMLILDKNADPGSKEYAQVTLRMEKVMDRLVDKIDPTDGLRESAMSELYLEVQEAGGLDAWIKDAKERMKRISRDLYLLDTQARREINAGGAFDSVEELEDAIEAEQREYNELKSKYDVVVSSTTDNTRSSKFMNKSSNMLSSIRSSRGNQGSKLTESSMSRNDMIDWIDDNYNTDENYEKLDDAISMIGYDADYIDDSDREEGMYANFSDEELSSIIYILKAREANSSPRQSSKIKSDFTNMSREEMIDWLEDNWNTNEGYKQLNAAIDAIGYDSDHIDDSDEEEGMYANFSDEDLENIISVLKTGRTKDGHDTSVKPQRIPMTDKKAKDIFKLALNDLGRAVEIDKGTGSALAMYNVMIDGKEYQVQIYRMG